MLASVSILLRTLQRQPASAVLAGRLSHSLAAASSSSSSSSGEQTFPLSPGGLLHICCTQPGTSVDISNGAEDAVSLQAEAQPQGTATASSSLCHDSSSSSSSSFQMQLLPGGRIVEAVERAPSSSSSSSRLTAAMPSRFCGVHVSTAGGSVAVGAVQEADLQLLTRGGAVAVRRCKANHAAINTAREPQQAGRGGSMQVGELSASVLRLSSGGGAISVQRLFALDAQLVSQGGAVGVGALYGVKVALDSCAGPLAVGHMSCSGLAMLQSGGAALAVEGLEGNASLISAGGDVKVHLHEHFGHVFVDSGGGAVEAWLNPAAPVSLQVAAGGGVCLDPALRVTGELGPASLIGVTGGGSSSSSSSSRAAAAAEAAVRLQQAGDASPSALGQPAGSSFNASRLHRSRSEVAQFGAEGQPTSPNISQVGNSHPSSSSSTNGCRQANSSGAAEAPSGSASGRTVRHLTINAGGGRVTLRAMGWMDGVRAKLQAKQAQQQQH